MTDQTKGDKTVTSIDPSRRITFAELARLNKFNVDRETGLKLDRVKHQTIQQHPKLSRNKRVFVHSVFSRYDFPTLTDAYIHAYDYGGSRTQASNNASTLYNASDVQELLRLVIEAKRQVVRESKPDIKGNVVLPFTAKAPPDEN